MVPPKNQLMPLVGTNGNSYSEVNGLKVVIISLKSQIK
jgi:hypothetical protein